MPVEIEWALDDDGFKLLQARPLHVEPIDRAGRDLAAASRPQRPSGRHRLGLRPRRGGQLRVRAVARGAGRHAGDQGRGSGAQPHPAARRRRGGGARRLDLASRLARARARHSDGARRARRHATHPRRLAGRGRRRRRRRAVDAHDASRASSSPSRSPKSALERLRKVASVTVNPDVEPDHRQDGADRRREEMRHPVLPAARQDRPRGDRRQSEAAADRLAVDLARPTSTSRPRPRAAFRSPSCRRSPPRRPPTQFRPDARGGAPHGRGRPPGARAANFPARSRRICSARRSGARPSAWSAAAGASARRWRGARTASACACSTGRRAASRRARSARPA